MHTLKSIYLYCQRIFRGMISADVFGLSAQLAFFFLLSLFPFLLFLVTLLGFLPIDEDLLTSFLNAYAPSEIVYLIESNLTELVRNQSGGLLSLGVVVTLWSSSNGVNAITKSLNRAYEVVEDRAFLHARFISILLTIAMLGVIGIALALPVFGKAIGVYLFSLIDLSDNFLQIWNALRWGISSVVLFIVLLALYKLAPNLKVAFRDAIWGSVFATFSWQIVSLGFSYYVSNLGNYSATYGSLGTVIILMFWFYLSGVIIIIGGVINADFKQHIKK